MMRIILDIEMIIINVSRLSNFKRAILLSVLLAITFSSSFAQVNQVKRAMDHIAENNMIKAEELLLKAYEKDTLSPTIQYGLSVLFTQTSYSQQNIDTAYHFIVQAMHRLNSLEEKEKDKINKSEFDQVQFLIQRKLLDSLVYYEALKTNTVNEWKNYIRVHNPSDFVQKAWLNIYSLEFVRTERLNTYKDYLLFAKAYPEAPQTDEALRRYEKLYYEDFTKSGTLDRFEEFLKIQPETPYRNVVERKILEIKGVNHEPEGYISFINNYPDSQQKRIALDFLFHALDKENFPGQWLNDSLRIQMKGKPKFTIPIYKNGNYLFLGQEGIRTNEGIWLRVNDAYLCKGNSTDFILAGEEAMNLYTRDQKIVYKGELEDIEDLGKGVVKIIKEGKAGAIFKNGRMILPPIYEEVKLCAESVIAFKQNGLWGFSSVFGNKLFPAIIESIQEKGKLLILKRADKFAIIHVNELGKSIQNIQPHVLFIYDDFDFWKNDIIWVKIKEGQKEGLLNKDPGFVMLPEHQEIFSRESGYIIKKESKWKYIDSTFNSSGNFYDKLDVNDYWIVGKSDKNYDLINRKNDQYYQTDSAGILGNKFVFALSKDSIFLPFQDTIFTIESDKFKQIRLLKGGKNTEFIWILSEEGILISSSGKEIWRGKTDEISLLGSEYFLLESKKKKRLFAMDGKAILENKYDAIALQSPGEFTLLNQGLLGFYNREDSVLIEPKFTKKIFRISKNRYLVFEDGYKFVDRQLEPLDSKSFQEFEWLSDSMMVVKDDKYQLINPHTGKIIIKGLVGYKLILDQGEKVWEIESERGRGIVSSIYGVVVPPVYTFINTIKGKDHFYVAEQLISEADFYSIIYYNHTG
ncbi:MAG: WG repeat-containing protein, partial [Cyclobacteriaceae bacterium]|nr:WG repeat-containing protein [Cyclobacteriaceae bacterium]